MTERDTEPPDASSGAMTGATGSLTPDDIDEPFVPAELREIADPDLSGVVTTAQPERAADHIDEDDEAT